ncbi:hypothetical protein QKT49_gp224 [Acanthamoeba castellanii medusavirus]|uniref:Uncharacterized protein n=1 Tax=Acanthamoeba castellanii medusavirus J1 TaxID=3114988 RepID=A0A3T1CXL6_9VIRU|nr:hypothetical protein QKT49_gp224 [Acanthamoeba castellanii medusavirus]BBI30539.1 hypothetical protein [Acanthamoeba castellanii medusavirus J1]
MRAADVPKRKTYPSRDCYCREVVPGTHSPDRCAPIYASWVNTRIVLEKSICGRNPFVAKTHVGCHTIADLGIHGSKFWKTQKDKRRLQAEIPGAARAHWRRQSDTHAVNHLLLSHTTLPPELVLIIMEFAGHKCACHFLLCETT